MCAQRSGHVWGMFECPQNDLRSTGKTFLGEKGGLGRGVQDAKRREILVWSGKILNQTSRSLFFHAQGI